jgi:hypothetical protein
MWFCKPITNLVQKHNPAKVIFRSDSEMKVYICLRQKYMKKLKVGIIREGKVPHDKRVAFTPEQCAQISKEYPEVELVIQPSEWRSFTDAEYEKMHFRE